MSDERENSAAAALDRFSEALDQLHTDFLSFAARLNAPGPRSTWEDVATSKKALDAAYSAADELFGEK